MTEPLAPKESSTSPKLPPRARAVIAQAKAKQPPKKEHGKIRVEVSRPFKAGKGPIKSDTIKGPPNPIPPTKPGETHKPYNGIEVVPHHSDSEEIRAEFYSARFSDKALEKLHNETDAQERRDLVTKKVHLMAGVGTPPRGMLGSVYANDVEAIWRHIEGIPMEGARGPTVEQTAETAQKKSAKKD